MELLIQRYSDNRDDTIGLLFKKIQFGSETKTSFMCYTLEDQFQEQKVSKETRIPSGFYELIINKADTPLTLKYRTKYSFFKYHIQVKNVPGFQGVYIHIGNNDDNSEGCILLGDAANNNILGPGTITNSTQAFTRFYNEIYNYLDKGGKVHLEIRDENNLL